MLAFLTPRAKATLLVVAAHRTGTLRLLGDATGHEFHGNQYSDVGAAAKLNAGHHIDGRKVAYVGAAILRGDSAKNAGVEAGATDEHVAAAQTLVNATRSAPESSTTLYRGIGSDAPIALLENAKPGDVVSLGQVSSFTESPAYAAHYATQGGTRYTYTLKTDGPVKSVPTDTHTGLSHQEHLTQGKFQVISHTSSGHEHAITLRQVGVF